MKPERVWELLLIFTDSAVRTLAKAIRITDSGGTVNSDLTHALTLPEHLLPEPPCFWVNWSKRCLVKSSPLLEAPVGGSYKERESCLITFP